MRNKLQEKPSTHGHTYSDEMLLSLTSKSEDLLDTPVESQPDIVSLSSVKKEKGVSFVGPPRPVNRDGLGRYVPPDGGKPLSSYDEPTPGPGSYLPNTNFTLKSNPAYTMRSKPDASRPKKGTPAPNAYKTQGSMTWGRCKRITFKNLTHPKKTAKQAQPSIYDTRTKVESGPKFSMSGKPKSNRVHIGLTNSLFCKQDPDGPGPDYFPDPDEWIQKPMTFGMKKTASSKKPGPGPQKYMVRAPKSGREWTFGATAKEKKDEDSPGPASYSAKPVIGNGPRFTIGRVIKEHKKTDQTPGPDRYHRAGFRLDEPGFTMKYRWFDTAPERRPGPNKYKSKIDMTVPRAPAFSIKNPRDETYPKYHPGPADYDPHEANFQAKKGKTIGVLLPNPVSTDPGPASYKPTLSNLKKSPQYSLAGRNEHSYDPDEPGPQTYDVKDPYKSMGRSIGVRAADKHVSSGPGPAPRLIPPCRSCKPCSRNGINLKSRHTPIKYCGFKNPNNIPPAPRDFPVAPLLG